MVSVTKIAAPVETERCGWLYQSPCRSELSAESWGRWGTDFGRSSSQSPTRTTPRCRQAMAASEFAFNLLFLGICLCSA